MRRVADSFGLLCASVSFFDEEKVADAAEKEELERLSKQAQECMRHVGMLSPRSSIHRIKDVSASH
eukprot:20904-Eustigmatos_ZCMA.PRE.1